MTDLLKTELTLHPQLRFYPFCESTEAVLVKDILPGQAWSYPQFLTDVDGTLFFSALTRSHGELWKSDGTEAGTVMVKILIQVLQIMMPSLENINGVLFFIELEVHLVKLIVNIY